MKVETVTIKKFKVLEDFEQEINGNHILLLGDNGVGKSSFLQFIQIALGQQTNIPINDTGEGEVLINKNGSQYKFAVKFKDNKPVITVTSPDGLKDSRKGTIAGIVGALDFNIDEFVELSKSTAGKKKQVEIFKSFLPTEVIDELAKYEQNIKVSYSERTDLNRHIKEKEAIIKLNTTANFVGKKFKKVDVNEIYAQLKSIQENNEKVIKIESGLVERKNNEVSNLAKIENLKAEIEELQKVNITINTGIVKANEWLSKNSKQDISVFEEQIKNANSINKQYEESLKLKSDLDKLEIMKEESGELGAKIDSSKEAIANTIRDMDSPVKGLEFDDETLIYNGVPVSPDTLSTSEIMELGIRLKMAENPELGILFIERGESLGTERLKTIKEIADKEGWQIIMEQVERGTKKLHIEIMADTG